MIIYYLSFQLLHSAFPIQVIFQAVPGNPAKVPFAPFQQGTSYAPGYYGKHRKSHTRRCRTEWRTRQ